MKIMRALILGFGFLLLFTASNTFAQPPNAPVEVIKMRWRMTSRNPALDQDAFRPGDDQLSTSVDSSSVMQQNAPKHDVAASVRPRGELTTSRLSTRFVYEVKVKNVGQKEIQSLIWDYVFLDPQSRAEIGRRHFKSVAKIGAGKTKNLMIRSAAPPTATMNAASTTSKIENQYAGQIVIQSILYADGSQWNAAARH